MIQLHRLEGFYWVARFGGYAEAARNFPYPITQPGVFQQVKKLETELGSELFERVGRDRVRLTAAGHALYEFAAPFFAELPGVVRAIRAESFGGELRIDGVGLTVRGLLPPWIRRLHDERPDIRVVLEEVASPEPERLRTGEADLIVDYLPEVPPGVRTRRVGTAYAFIAVPDDHPLARRQRISVAELGSTPFVSYPPGTKHHGIQMATLERFEVTPSRTLATASVDSILSFVRAGLGFSLIPWLDRAGPDLPGVRALRQRGEGSEFPIVAAWRPGPAENPLVAAALRLLPGAGA